MEQPTTEMRASGRLPTQRTVTVQIIHPPSPTTVNTVYETSEITFVFQVKGARKMQESSLN